MAGRKRNLLKAGAGYTIGNYLLKGVVFLTTPLFARLMSTADYGKYNVFTSYGSIFYVILGLAIHTSYRNAYYKYRDEGDPDNERRYRQYVSATMFFLVASFAVWMLIGVLFQSQAASLLKVDSIIVLLIIIDSLTTCISSCFSADKGIHYQYKEILIVSVISTVSSIGLALLLINTVFADQKYMGRILGGLIPTVLINGFIAARYMFRASPRGMGSGLKWGIRYSLPIVPHGISQIILSQFDRIMISRMSGDSQAGIYSFAYTIYSMLAITANSIDGIWSPWYYEKRKAEDYDAIRKGSSFYMLIVFAASVGVIALCPELIMILGGAKYHESIYCAIPIIVGGFFACIYNVPCIVEYYHEKTKLIAISTVASAALNVLLNWLFIPVYGYVAASYTTLFTYVIYFISHYLMARRIEHKNLFSTKLILLFSVVLGITAAISLLCVDRIWIRLLLLAAIVGTALFLEERQFAYIRKWLAKRKENH